MQWTIRRCSVCGNPSVLPERARRQCNRPIQYFPVLLYGIVPLHKHPTWVRVLTRMILNAPPLLRFGHYDTKAEMAVDLLFGAHSKVLAR